jgi:hypothetical protein
MFEALCHSDRSLNNVTTLLTIINVDFVMFIFIIPAAGPENLTLILAGSFTALLIFIITTSAILVAVLRSRRQDKKMPVNFIVKPPAPDVELANLRELPTISVQQANTLYAIRYVKLYSSANSELFFKNLGFLANFSLKMGKLKD